MTDVHQQAAVTVAVRRRDWDRTALYLLLGFARAARRVPAGDMADLLALLGGDDDGTQDG